MKLTQSKLSHFHRSHQKHKEFFMRSMKNRFNAKLKVAAILLSLVAYAPSALADLATAVSLQHMANNSYAASVATYQAGLTYWSQGNLSAAKNSFSLSYGHASTALTLYSSSASNYTQAQAQTGVNTTSNVIGITAMASQTASVGSQSGIYHASVGGILLSPLSPSLGGGGCARSPDGDCSNPIAY